MAEDRKLEPDRQLLAGFAGFPGFANIKLPESQAYHVISNTFDTFTFRLKLEGERPKGYPADLIVRLELSEGRLAQVAALQHLGHRQLPDVVPETLDTGVVKDATERRLEYSISPYVEGAFTLEDIWDSIPIDNQQALVDSITDVIGKLHDLDLGSGDVREQVLNSTRP